MTLTEQWKKGELDEGFYYVKDGENTIAEYIDGYFYNNGQPMTSFSGGVDEVLAPVPSYEEWKSAYECQLMESELVLTLKECKHIMNIEKDFASCHFEKQKLDELLTKIDEVLK